MPKDLKGIRNITISGRIASGTTTLAHNIAEELGWDLLEGGELFRKFHEEHLNDKSEIAVNMRPDDVDLEYEKKIKDILENETHRIIQSHLSGFDAQGIPEIFKILVICEDDKGSDHADIRIDRLVNRKKISVDEAKKEIVERENNNLEKWRRMYAKGDPNWVYWDPKYYDLVINTFSNDAKTSFEIVLEELKKYHT
jgi:cytidylate kinase